MFITRDVKTNTFHISITEDELRTAYSTPHAYHMLLYSITKGTLGKAVADTLFPTQNGGNT